MIWAIKAPVTPALKVEASSEAEAAKLQAGYKDWVFVVESYLADRYRHGLAELKKSEPKEVTPSKDI